MNAPKITKPAPWDRVNFVSKIFFTWVWPLYITGHKRDLQFYDLYKCAKNDEADKVGDKLERTWNTELNKSKPNFAWAVFKTFLPEFLPFFFVFMFQECIVRLSQPIFLGIVLRYFENPDGEISRQKAVLCACGIVLCSAVFITVNHINLACSLRIGFRMRVACSTLMYRKSIRLNRAALAETTVGQIVNMLSSDVNRFDEVSMVMHAPVVSVMQTILVMFMLWGHLGWACLTGITLLVLFVPFQGLMGRLFQAVRRKTTVLTDNRIKIMNEIITGMRVIKMYCWEKPFSKVVDKARKAEIGCIRQASYLKAINLAIYFTSSKIILFACFVTYVYIKGRLSPEALFTAVAYFNTMRITVTKSFPNSIAAYAETYVSCKRIETFLLHEEIKKSKTVVCNGTDGNNNFEMNTKNGPSGEKGVVIENATARWNKDIAQPTFSNLSVHVKPGELLIIIGPVGSGKSSTLMALLDELPLESGKISVTGKMSYAPQEAWAFQDSVKSNIVFNAPYDEQKYNEVVRVCALQRDMAQWPFGDKTIVGERGVSLSGGQKTRITLARALYNEADIFLLDDVLSAVDTHVAKHIFNKCIMEHLKDKARILVTHQLQYLHAADRILILKSGQFVACGTFAELKEQGINFSSFVSEKKNDNTKPSENARQEQFRHRTFSWSPSINSNESEISLNAVAEGSVHADSLISLSTTRKELKYDTSAETSGPIKEAPVLVEESRQSGSISGGVYWQYIKASQSPFLILVALVSMVASQCFFQASDIWITEWTRSRPENASDSNTNTSSHRATFDWANLTASNDSFVLVYSCLIAAMFVCALIRTTSFFVIGSRSSINLHNSIFNRILRTHVSHFDQNPSGRILNRFSKDCSHLDENIPAVAYELQVTLTTILGILLVNVYTNIYLIVPGIFLACLVFLFRYFYINSARDIKRLEGIARSPIYGHVNNTLTGLSTIRSFGAESLFIKQFYEHQNVHNACYFLCICSARGFGVLMDWICLLYIASVVVFVMLFPGVAAGYAGLALSSSLVLTGVTQWAVRSSADLESYMTSVERILEYTHLEVEDDARVLTKKHYPLRAPPKEKWPTSGEIVFENLSLFYDGSTQPVLKGISCQIDGGSKVGVVGRTGAGKSSLIAALFRLCRRAEGVIKIDGVDTTQITLKHLRKNISIIPQEPLIFTGTVRYNVDPFGEHSDERLWEVLEEVQLKEAISNLPSGLDSQLNEGGNNFSVGQKQLVCLARAIIRRNRILVMDEATSNVDNQTDSLIQKAIRHHFASCTVLTVAHRLNTIIDCDKVMVLDAGRLIEYGAPFELFRRPDGAFTSLVEQTGKRMANKLKHIAREAFYGMQYREEDDEEVAAEEENESKEQQS